MSHILKMRISILSVNLSPCLQSWVMWREGSYVGGLQVVAKLIMDSRALVKSVVHSELTYVRMNPLNVTEFPMIILHELLHDLTMLSTHSTVFVNVRQKREF
jgi:hypothetical protein